MRLGAWTCILQEGSLAAKAYGGATEISERTGTGMNSTASMSAAQRRRAAAERHYAGLDLCGDCRVAGASLFLGCQFHPESSRSR